MHYLHLCVQSLVPFDSSICPLVSLTRTCIVASVLLPVGSLVGVFALAGVFDTSRYMLNTCTPSRSFSTPPLLNNHHVNADHNLPHPPAISTMTTMATMATSALTMTTAITLTTLTTTIAKMATAATTLSPTTLTTTTSSVDDNGTTARAHSNDDGNEVAHMANAMATATMTRCRVQDGGYRYNTM